MIFHLAIPAKDLFESKEFYKIIGAEVGREYDTHIVLNFFECQLVLHLSDKIVDQPQMYPRHFGVILENYDQLFLMHAEVLDAGVRLWEPLFIRWEPLFIRKEGKFEEHRTFFICDPSNNLIEFKAYKNKEAIFT